MPGCDPTAREHCERRCASRMGHRPHSGREHHPTAQLGVAGATAIGARTWQLALIILGADRVRAGVRTTGRDRPATAISAAPDTLPSPCPTNAVTRSKASCGAAITAVPNPGVGSCRRPSPADAPSSSGSFRGDVAPAIPGEVHLATALRQLTLPRPVRTRTLTTWRQERIGVAAEVVRRVKVLASPSAWDPLRETSTQPSTRDRSGAGFVPGLRGNSRLSGSRRPGLFGYTTTRLCLRPFTPNSRVLSKQSGSLHPMPTRPRSGSRPCSSSGDRGRSRGRGLRPS